MKPSKNNMIPTDQEIWKAPQKDPKKTNFFPQGTLFVKSQTKPPTPFSLSRTFAPCRRLSQKSKVTAKVKIEAPKAQNKVSQRKEETLPWYLKWEVSFFPMWSFIKLPYGLDISDIDSIEASVVESNGAQEQKLERQMAKMEQKIEKIEEPIKRGKPLSAW